MKSKDQLKYLLDKILFDRVSLHGVLQCYFFETMMVLSECELITRN